MKFATKYLVEFAKEVWQRSNKLKTLNRKLKSNLKKINKQSSKKG